MLGKVRRRVVVGLSFVALAAIALGAGWSQASAAAQSSSSDPRARFVEGNVTSCGGVGYASDLQLASSSNSSASDAHIGGTVKTNAGGSHSGQGQELDVATTGTGFVIDAIVVKGGPAYNVYTNPSVLPPVLRPDQHYISPLNHGGNVPAISHWFVCYRAAPSPTTTSTTTTTVLATPSSSSPPVTRSVARTTIASTATTSTTAAPEVLKPRSAIPHTPKASTTTQPSTTTVASTLPRRSHETPSTIAATALVALPETGASTASFVVGCATAILGLVVLALRPRG